MPSVRGQVYCSKDCAPYGHWQDTNESAALTSHRAIELAKHLEAYNDEGIKNQEPVKKES